MKFHHLGIACGDIEKAIIFVKRMHEIEFQSEIIFDKHQNANLCLLRTDENIGIELVSGEKVMKLVKRNTLLYHTCWEVDVIEDSIMKLLKNSDTILLSEPTPAILFNNRKVAFIHTPIGVVELLEKENED
jgi:methylmalonyl-CoA/ethylmalonyl-CoA epimerase